MPTCANNAIAPLKAQACGQAPVLYRLGVALYHANVKEAQNYCLHEPFIAKSTAQHQFKRQPCAWQNLLLPVLQVCHLTVASPPAVVQ